MRALRKVLHEQLEYTCHGSRVHRVLECGHTVVTALSNRRYPRVRCRLCPSQLPKDALTYRQRIKAAR